MYDFLSILSSTIVVTSWKSYTTSFQRSLENTIEIVYPILIFSIMSLSRESRYFPPQSAYEALSYFSSVVCFHAGIAKASLRLSFRESIPQVPVFSVKVANRPLAAELGTGTQNQRGRGIRDRKPRPTNFTI